MWFLAYAIPCLLAGTAIKLLPKSKDRVGTPFITIAVATLFISIFVSQYFIHTSGFVFPWYPKALSIVAYVLSVFIATRLIGKMSMWYSPFALIQELAIASITFLLLPSFPIYLIILLIVPIFVWGHSLRTNRWLIRVVLLAVLGAISVSLFSTLLDFYLLAALHTLLGAILISKFIIYPQD